MSSQKEIYPDRTAAAPCPGDVALRPGAVAVRPGAVAVRPGAVAVRPGAVAVRPGAVAVRPGAVAVRPGEAEPPCRGAPLQELEGGREQLLTHRMLQHIV